MRRTVAKFVWLWFEKLGNSVHRSLGGGIIAVCTPTTEEFVSPTFVFFLFLLFILSFLLIASFGSVIYLVLLLLGRACCLRLQLRHRYLAQMHREALGRLVFVLDFCVIVKVNNTRSLLS